MTDGREYAHREASGHGERTRTDMGTPPCRAFPFEFSKDVSAGTTRDSFETREREVPYDGWIIELVVGWPAGADNGVGVQFRRKSGEVFFPRNKEDAYIAQDDFQHPYNVCAPVREGEVLVAQYINTDTSNSHFVNVVPTIQEAEASWP